MKIEAEMVEDSIFNGNRLTTMQLTYPRFIHAEFMTHRVFSRNASSSRAIPVQRLVDMALEDPAFFVEVGRNQPGMQADKLVPEAIRSEFEEEWNELARIAAKYAQRWARQYGIHKQVVNRVMEPWHHIKVVVTANQWTNFFELRDHPDAQPEIRALARAMKKCMAESVPVERRVHLPYVRDDERKELKLPIQFKLSTARCARVSYMKHDGTMSTIDDDIELHDDLVVRRPIHASPSEHQAIAWKSYIPEALVSNITRPWVQYRRYVEKGIVIGAQL